MTALRYLLQVPAGTPIHRVTHPESALAAVITRPTDFRVAVTLGRGCYEWEEGEETGPVRCWIGKQSRKAWIDEIILPR